MQDNDSPSMPTATVRHLHFHVSPVAQAKLICCSMGEILNIAADIRRNSPALEHHTSIELSEANGHRLHTANGFADVDPASEKGVARGHSSLEIDWSLEAR
jgi:dTDP-4-dehydrorhamnose 3,5-epimerase